MKTYIVLIVALVAIIGCIAEDMPTQTINDFCPKTNFLGQRTYLLPHANCKKYYVCNDGEAIEFNCPEKQEYNPKTMVCGFPTGNCKPVPEKIQLTCPKNASPNYLYAHISDCDKFYKCNFGEMVEFSCPEGQSFLSNLKLCGRPGSGCKLLEV